MHWAHLTCFPTRGNKMAKSRQSVTFYHDPDPVYYSLTQPEFDQLCDKAKVPERENTLFLLGLLVPSGINAVICWPTDQSSITAGWVLNLLVAIVAGVLFLVQGRIWLSKKGDFTKYIATLKEKPRIKMELTTTPNAYTRSTPSDSEQDR